MQEMSTNGAEKMIAMKTNDGVEFLVAEEVARMSRTLEHMIEDKCAENTIPLPNVNAKILGMAITYCEVHVYKKDGDATLSDSDMEKWDKEFMSKVADHATLLDLIMGANFLDIDGLLNLACKTVADQIAGKTPQQIRQHFHIENDYTSDEEEEVRRELSWAFE